MSARPCIDCKKRPAKVPDRNRMGRLIARRCLECHAALLRGDLQQIVARRAERGAERKQS